MANLSAERNAKIFPLAVAVVEDLSEQLRRGSDGEAGPLSREWRLLPLEEAASFYFSELPKTKGNAWKARVPGWFLVCQSLSVGLLISPVIPFTPHPCLCVVSVKCASIEHLPCPNALSLGMYFYNSTP